ncbi:MAG: C39 family peptidase, partial [Patescibacteria group bacterium]
MTNLLFGIPKKTTTATFSWRPFIVLGLVLSVALGMRLYQWIRGPAVPTADVESIGWEDVEGDEVGKLGGDEVLGADGGINTTDGTDGETDGSETSEEKDPDDRKDLENSGVINEDVPAILLPDAINLAVPFTSQAPLGIWDEFTEETCEEASFLMVYEYYQGAPEGSIDPATADADFRTMVLAQENMGFGVSISTAQFLSFAEAYDGTVARVIENPSADDLRALLATGHPVIIPAFGRNLGNPFFTGEGPLYHMLVLRGYTPTTFITNDPG